MQYKLFIPAAGTGSRLGDHCRHLNKSLVSVGHRPTLSHILDKVPESVPVVIALGFKGELVRDFIALAYPSRDISFVDVMPFEGDGSGLGTTMNACRKELQCPFIFCSCDTLVEEPFPDPTTNWMGYAEVRDNREYRTIETADGKVISLLEKRVESATNRAYIGLAGVFHFKEFWRAFDEQANEDAAVRGESAGLAGLIRMGITAHVFSWYDTGSVSGLEIARQKFQVENGPSILPKADEDIWFIGDNVIKFSANKKFIADRVARCQSLEGYVPPVWASRANMYAYKKVEGKVLSRCVSLPVFDRFLREMVAFWTPREMDEGAAVAFRETCLEFYKKKSFERVAQYLRKTGTLDTEICINDEMTPGAVALLQRLDWSWLCSGFAARFHGDLHFENVLLNTNGGFTLLDWRQSFGEEKEFGDLYYDLGKIRHGLIVSHELISKDLYSVGATPERVSIEIHRHQSLVECEQHFDQFVEAQGWDKKKVHVMTALIYLNIAALHHEPYGTFLYYMGRLFLSRALRG